MSGWEMGWKRSMALLFLYGMSVCVMNGILFHQPPGVMVRDIAAFFFFMLPLFFYDLFARQARAQVWLSGLIIIIGCGFAVRALLPVYGFYEAPEELLYLANSPLVLLSALLLMAGIFHDVYSRRMGVRSVLCCALLIVPLAAMLIDVQRAPMVAVTMSAVVAIMFVLFYRPRRGGILLACGVLLMFLLSPVFQDISNEILNKTARVGLNMRAEELRAVLHAIGGDFYSALFGLGWGARFSAPSVGGLYVSYTHSLLSYFLLKGGMTGLFLAILVCWQVVRSLWPIAGKAPVIGFILFWPFIIPVLFYASHKSLDFGLVLLFIFIYGVRVRYERGAYQGNEHETPEYDRVLLPKGAA